ncbi:MAG: twin-arginine translocase subunit TatB [Rhizobiales bacterium]|nr:twin-arginine translocase subunit TatB [Hyphomicrobiales bacterium]
MFDIGWSELLLIGIVALVVIGPKDLPKVLRGLGAMMSKVRSMAAEFQGQFQDAMRDAELADLKKQAEDLASSATNAIQNPVQSIESELQKSVAEAKPAPVATDAQVDAAIPAPAQSAGAADAVRKQGGGA